MDTAVNWSHRYSQSFLVRARYQFTRLTTQLTPYFANRANVSGDAGIAGNAQDPVNWGPPNLIFTSIEGLADGKYTFTRNQTHAWNAESLVTRGRHAITIGGDVRKQHVDVLSQQDPRGSFAFTGTATGSDLADFLLGIPQASAIAFGNADKFLRASAYDAYANDDWRVSPGFTTTLGLRWEYETPMSELFGRLVNLDVASGFIAVSPVIATNPVGSLTGRRYPDSLVRPDKRGVGASTGDWHTATFPDLAGDVVAAFEYLKTRPDIYRTRIGLLCWSQAGWVMPLDGVPIVYVAIFNNARRPTALTGPLDILGVLLALFPGS